MPADRANFLVYTLREPVGVVGGDHPLELAAAAADAGSSRRRWRPGCTVVVQARRAGAGLDARVRARCSSEAGFPPGVFNVVTGFGRGAGAPLVAIPASTRSRSRASTETGKAV